MASNSEDELIDLDKVLPLKKDYNWLLESNSNCADFYGSFNELNFSNPLIKNFIKAIYLNGKSKQMLHNLMNWDQRMTVSCDSYSYLGNNYLRSHMSKSNEAKRHSLSIVTSKIVEDSLNSESESLTDSLNSVDSINDVEFGSENKNIQNKSIYGRIIQSNSTTGCSGQISVLQKSEKLPVTKNVSDNQNVLSRTYDKEDLEILKQTQLSQSVFVPHISGSNTDHYSEIECKRKSIPAQSSRCIKTKQIISKNDKNSFRRLFPTADSKNDSPFSLIRPRPNSMYQIDKNMINKIPSDRSVKINQQKKLNVNTKLLLKVNQNIFESDVVTSLNSQRNVKKSTIMKETILKPPFVKRFIK